MRDDLIQTRMEVRNVGSSSYLIVPKSQTAVVAMLFKLNGIEHEFRMCGPEIHAAFGLLELARVDDAPRAQQILDAYQEILPE